MPWDFSERQCWNRIEKIGFIGLGAMGGPMARNIMKAGYSLAVYDISEDAVKSLAGEGAAPCSTCAETADGADVIITMVPDSRQVEQVILGPGGVLETAKEGSIIIDMSTIDPEVTRKVAVKVAEKGVRMIDAPVCRSTKHAEEGKLMILVGGAKEDYETALAEFEWTLPYLGHDHYVLVQLSGLYLYANRPGKAVEICDRLIREGQNDPVVYYNKACAHAMNGERDEALKALLAAVRRGYKNMKNLQKDPDLESVRDDPRYVAILDEVPL